MGDKVHYDPSRSSPEASTQPQMVRVVDRDRASLSFTLDGASAIAYEGDTILTAVLTVRARLAEPGPVDGPRAGFCLMGACQECWVAVDGTPMRACGTLVAAGMRVTTDRQAAGG
jgi:predicted molibdopterin-dependent oxidoreductase YjgC